MNSHQALALEIVSRLNESLVSCDFLAKGATCEAFKLTTNVREYVLRISTPNKGKSSNFESNFALRQSLSALSKKVALPIATNLDFDGSAQGSDWALDSYCEGGFVSRGEIPQDVSRQLGRVLKHLHSLPCKGHGALKNSRGLFLGSCADTVNGLLSRFEKPWPFCDYQLSVHPSVQVAPALLDKLVKLEDEFRRFASGGGVSVLHGDLHEQQFLVHKNQLVALLDFNESFIGRCEWDFGSYLYFHGERCLAELLDGYCEDAAEKEAYERGAWLASLLIALHHGNRAVVLSRPHRLDASVEHLKKALLLEQHGC